MNQQSNICPRVQRPFKRMVNGKLERRDERKRSVDRWLGLWLLLNVVCLCLWKPFFPCEVSTFFSPTSQFFFISLYTLINYLPNVYFAWSWKTNRIAIDWKLFFCFLLFVSWVKYRINKQVRKVSFARQFTIRMSFINGLFPNRTMRHSRNEETSRSVNKLIDL
jgi:hypothetical protein